MTLILDRTEIECAGADPVRLARALLRQLPDLDGRVPIDEIALALDIVGIEKVRLHSIEACLQCDLHKSEGQIVVNAGSSLRRQRFSIGHELGHFLNEAHEPFGPGGFDCTRQDMVSPRREGRHLRQEREANTFAIEVLTPRRLLEQHLAPAADLEHALSIADRFEISRAAAVRRYVDLHSESLAAVFSKHGRILYVSKPYDFPRLAPWTGDSPGPVPTEPRNRTSLTGLDQVDAVGWLHNHDHTEVFVQTLYQRDGHAITLVLAEQGDMEELDEPVFRRSRRKP